MPHIDELIGVATVATAGLFGAIALDAALSPERTIELRTPVSATAAVVGAHEMPMPPAIVARPAPAIPDATATQAPGV
jgi:hypothetical protein